MPTLNLFKFVDQQMCDFSKASFSSKNYILNIRLNIKDVKHDLNIVTEVNPGEIHLHLKNNNKKIS